MAQRLMVIAVKDKLSDIFSQPMYFPTVGMAVRAFQDALADTSSPFNKHPNDYDLYHLADWDDVNGAFHKLENTPALIAQGSQHKPRTA